MSLLTPTDKELDPMEGAINPTQARLGGISHGPRRANAARPTVQHLPSGARTVGGSCWRRTW